MSTPPILVTNHDRDYLEMLRDLLEEEGYTPVVCVGHLDAWPAMLREPPRLAVIDIRLRDPDVGWSLLEKMRLHPPTIATPAIVCTTDPKNIAHTASRMERLSYRMLQKPFLLEELVALVRELIGPPSEGERAA